MPRRCAPCCGSSHDARAPASASACGHAGPGARRMLSLQECRSLDAQDPLRGLRELFTLPEGVIYLDGNSLGPLPRHAPERIARAVREEWGEGLIRSWNTAGWFELPQRVGDRIATLIGARPGEVVA